MPEEFEVPAAGESGEQPQAKPAGSGDDAGKGKGGNDDAKALRDEIAALKRQNQELADSERYWADQARAVGKKGGKTEADPDDEGEEEPEDDEEDDDADKVVEDFSAKGIRALTKRGLITAKQAKELIAKEAAKIAREIVGTEAAKLRQDADLVQKYPELSDKDSDLFKRTAEVFKEMVADDPSLKKSPKALMMAARTAKAELRATQGRGEEDRLEKVRRQSGERGSRGRSMADGDDDDSIGPQTRAVLSELASYGVTEEGFKKQRQSVRGGRY